MNTVNITAARFPSDAYVFLDGKPVKLEGKDYLNRTATYQTESDVVEVTVKKVSEIGGKLWFLWAILFFFISVFGIFNPHYDKRYQTINYTQKFKLSGNNSIRLEINRFGNGLPAITCTNDCPAYKEVENAFGIDAVAKKRFKILTAVEVLIWIAAVVGVAVGIVLAIVK